MLNKFVSLIGISKVYIFVFINLVFEDERIRKSWPKHNLYLFKPQRVDAHINNFLSIQARELKFCVCYLREKSAPLTNFQPNWTTISKVRDFGHFICRVSSPIVGGGVKDTFGQCPKDRHFFLDVFPYYQYNNFGFLILGSAAAQKAFCGLFAWDEVEFCLK